jgi:hypothetical protein
VKVVEAKATFDGLHPFRLSISRLVSSGAANKIEIAAAENYLSSRDYQKLSL